MKTTRPAPPTCHHIPSSKSCHEPKLVVQGLPLPRIVTRQSAWPSATSKLAVMHGACLSVAAAAHGLTASCASHVLCDTHATASPCGHHPPTHQSGGGHEVVPLEGGQPPSDVDGRRDAAGLRVKPSHTSEAARTYMPDHGHGLQVSRSYHRLAHAGSHHTASTSRHGSDDAAASGSLSTRVPYAAGCLRPSFAWHTWLARWLVRIEAGFITSHGMPHSLCCAHPCVDGLDQAVAIQAHQRRAVRREQHGPAAPNKTQQATARAVSD